MNMRILLATIAFPNRIQPWMVNTTVHAVRSGAEVFIAATTQRGDSYQASVDEHGLLDKTIYLATGGFNGLLSPLRALLVPQLRSSALRGLARAPIGPWAPIDEPFKRWCLAATIGLPKVDLVHSHSMRLAYEFLRVAKSHGAPLVHTFHGLTPLGVEELPHDRMQIVFQEASALLVNTQFARQQLHDLGCPNEKIRILPQGTVLADFPFRPKASPMSSPVKFLSVGRLHEDKGHAYALKALAKLHSTGRDFRYRVVGVGPDRELLQQLAVDLGIGEKVHFTGAIDDEALRAEYADAHIFLFPSLRDIHGKHEETQGVAMQEAEASGCLIVTTRTGGIPESVDANSAIICPDRSEDALFDAIQTLLHHPERWPQWQHSGRKWIEDNYDIERIGDRLMNLYREVIAAHRGLAASTA